MAKEQSLRLKGIKYAKSIGWEHIRLHFGRGAARGWPDDLFLKRPGRSLWVEFKAPGKTPTPIQQHHLEVLQGMGFRAIYCDNFEDLWRHLEFS